MMLLFLHGWAFDSTLWQAMAAHLPGHRLLLADRGYFGPPADIRQTPDVAIGHSLGCLILARDLPPHVPLLAINGFDRFTGAGRVAPRVVQRMARRLGEAPAEVVDAFRQRCGAEPAAADPDGARLAADLELLLHAEAPDRPVLLLHGDCDPILPEAMRAAVFPSSPRHVTAGGHLLPLTHAPLCAEMALSLCR